MNKKIVLIFPIFLLIFCCTLSANAQLFHLELNFASGFPLGDFKESHDKSGMGMGGVLGIKVPEKPFVLGAEFNYFPQGLDYRYESGSNGIEARIKSEQTTLLTHFLVRYMPTHEGAFRPYMDGIIGMTFRSNETQINDKYDIGFNSTALDLDSSTLNYGGGIGVLLQLWTGEIEDENEINKDIEVLLDFRLRYVRGAKVETLQRGSLGLDDSTVTYTLEEVIPHFLTLHAGLAFNF